MKRKQVISVILIFIGISTYAQVDENGNYFQANKKEQHNLKSTNLTGEIPNIDFQFDSIRALSEINSPDNAEAYPWISNDGLRLYFTLETDSGNIIVMSEREHYDSPFATSQILSINSSFNDNMSPWLTDDELDIFFIIKESSNLLNNSLYHANRNNMEDEFGEPAQINLLGNISGDLRSPSFTMDMERLYMNNWNSGTENILIFEKVVVDEYQLIDTLYIPDGYEPGPGKLGQNDLKYYLSLSDEKSNSALYVYNRESIDDNFDSIYYLNNAIINAPQYLNHSPTISNNGNYFVFTRASEHLWSSNNLYIAYNNSFSVLVNNLHSDKTISVYPNPTIDYLTFEFHNSKDSRFTISIFTINGIHIESINVSKNSSKLVIPTSQYNSGIYLYEIMSLDSYIDNGKFIVKNH